MATVLNLRDSDGLGIDAAAHGALRASGWSQAGMELSR